MIVTKEMFGNDEVSCMCGHDLTPAVVAGKDMFNCPMCGASIVIRKRIQEIHNNYDYTVTRTVNE